MAGNLKSQHGMDLPSAESFLQAGSFVLNDLKNPALFWIRSGEFRDPAGLLLKKDDVVGEDFLYVSADRMAPLRASKDSQVVAVPRKTLVTALQNLPIWLFALFRALISRLRKAHSSPTHTSTSDALGALAFFLQRFCAAAPQEYTHTLQVFSWLTGVSSGQAAAAMTVLLEKGWILSAAQADSHPQSIRLVAAPILDVLAQYRSHRLLHRRFPPFELDAVARHLLSHIPAVFPVQTAAESAWLTILQKLNPQVQVRHLLLFKELGLWQVQGDGLIAPRAERLEWFACALAHQAEMEALP